jgi:hypothetical protein
MAKLTRPTPRPGHWPCRGHGRYHHCASSVSNCSMLEMPSWVFPSTFPSRNVDTCTKEDHGYDIYQTLEVPPIDASNKISTYPTERTRPVSARLDSSATPRMRCSRMDETSVGVALASAKDRTWTAGAAFRTYGDPKIVSRSTFPVAATSILRAPIAPKSSAGRRRKGSMELSKTPRAVELLLSMDSAANWTKCEGRSSRRTKATLLVAEIALTARVDCRRALRNISPKELLRSC